MYLLIVYDKSDLSEGFYGIKKQRGQKDFNFNYNLKGIKRDKNNKGNLGIQGLLGVIDPKENERSNTLGNTSKEEIGNRFDRKEKSEMFDKNEKGERKNKREMKTISKKLDKSSNEIDTPKRKKLNGDSTFETNKSLQSEFNPLNLSRDPIFFGQNNERMTEKDNHDLVNKIIEKLKIIPYFLPPNIQTNPLYFSYRDTFRVLLQSCKDELVKDISNNKGQLEINNMKNQAKESSSNPPARPVA